MDKIGKGCEVDNECRHVYITYSLFMISFHNIILSALNNTNIYIYIYISVCFSIIIVDRLVGVLLITKKKEKGKYR